MKILTNPKFVSKFPIATVFFLEGANIQQIYKMWSEHTAAGQSVGGWLFVWVALVMWSWYYKVCVPWENAKWAFWTTLTGVFINSFVIFSVLYWS
jgi:hypothetical protein